MQFFALWSIIYVAKENDAMKRSISILALLILVTAGAFGQISVGGGALFDWSFFNEVVDDGSSVKGSDGIRNMSFGGFVFFDATYAEIDINFGYVANGSTKATFDGDTETFDGEGGATVFGFGLLGKYPIDLGALTLAPMVGFNYTMWLAQKHPDYDDMKRGDVDDAGDFDQFSILFGAGLGVPFTDNLGLKADILLRLALPNKGTKDLADLIDGSALPGFGPLIRVGLQYTF